MSFTDLASLAAQRRQQPQPQPPQQAQQAQYDPTAPPDPSSFTQQPTNPTAAAEMQVASIDAAGGVPAGLESNEDLGDVQKTKDKADPSGTEPAPVEVTEAEREAQADEAYPPVVFAANNYRPPPNDRGPGGWGQSWPPLAFAETYPGVAPSGDLPSPMGGYGEIGRTGLYFQQNGPSSVGQQAGLAGALMTPLAALGDLLSQGRFSRSFTEAGLRRIRIQREQGLMAAEQAATEHTRYMTGWGMLFSGINPDHPTMSLKEFHENADRYLQMWGDEKGRVILHNYGPKALENYLNEQESYRLRLLGSHTQIRKATGPNEDARELGALGVRTGISTSSEGTGPLQFKVPGREAPEAPITPPADQAQPTTTAQAEPQPLSDVDKTISDHMTFRTPDGVEHKIPANETQGILQAAKERISGEPEEIHIKHGTIADTLIGQTQKALQAEINKRRAQTYPGRTPLEQANAKAAAIDQAVPGYGRKLAGLGNYTLNPKSIPEKDRARMFAQTQSIYPDFDEGTYDKVHVFSDTRSKENQTMVRATDAAQAGTVALDRLNNVIKKFGADVPIKEMYDQWLAGKFTGDKEFADLFQSLFVLSSASQAVYSMSGSGRVTLIKEMLKHLQPTASAQQIAAQIQTELSGVYSIVNDYQGQWTGLTGRGNLLPGMDRETFETLRGIVRMNPDTGQVPGDKNLPNALRRVGREGSAETAPLTMKEINKLEAFIRRERGNPDPEVQHQVLRAQQAIPPIIGIDRPIEGIDDIAD